MIYFSSDHHFGHKNIIKYENRPFANVWEMDREMLDRWNATVKPDDLIYYLGDLSFSGRNITSRLISRLNGRKILIRGNHDRGDQFFLENGFEQVHQKLEIEINGEKVLLSHYPYKYKEGEFSREGEVKYWDRRPDDNGGWLLHGHVHGLWKQRRKQICVAVENWDYSPVSIEKIQEIMATKNVE